MIPDSVREAALFPHVDLPEPPPDHRYRQVQRDGYMVGLFPGLTYGTVSVRAIGADAVEQTVRDARSVLADDGKSRGAWMIADAASPAGLAECSTSSQCAIPTPEIYGLEMSTVKEPRPESRSTFSVSVRSPQIG